MEQKEKYYTDFLISNSSFFTGIGSILNVPGNYYDYNHSETEEEADYKAIKSDWGMIGQDLLKALKKIVEQNYK